MSSECKVGAMSLDQRFQQFEADQHVRGFDEVLERHCLLTELAIHEHEFQAKALVVDGEMRLNVEGERITCGRGARSSWMHDCRMRRVTEAKERLIGLPGDIAY